MRVLIYSYLLIVYITITFSLPLVAQNTQDVSVYKNKSKRTLGISDDKNYVKWNYSLVGRGIFAICYERALHPKHTIEIGAGPTYRDLLFEIWNRNTINTLESNNINSKFGYFFNVAYKFYPNDYEDFDGIYISPGFSYKQYGLGYTPDNVNGVSNLSTELPVSYNMLEGYAKFGYVFEDWWFDGLLIDFYCGLGFRNWAGYHIDKIEDTVSEMQKIAPAIYIGVKSGFAF